MDAPTRAPAPAPPFVAGVVVEHVLTQAQACDLDLVLAAVLPPGTVLGSPDRQVPTDGKAARLAVRVPVEAAADALLPGATLLLRDPEHTPVAELRDLTAVTDPTDPTESNVSTDAGRLLNGTVSPGRRRESGALPGLHADLTDPALRGRAVLLLARPPVADDEADLDAWVADAGPRPLLLVPEDGEGEGRLPAGTAWRLARDLAAARGLHDAEVLLAPLHLRASDLDDRLAGLLGERLGAAPLLALTATSPAAGAQVWAGAARVLRRGAAEGSLTGVAPPVEAVLRRWRPRRAERGLVVLMTGLSGSGKSTLARDLSTYLLRRSERDVTLLDGDVVRRLLSAGLGFDRPAREANVRRIGWVAARVAEHGGTAVCSPIAPFAATRQEVRSMVEQVGDLVLVHVSTPLQECERRDLKGLYARARRGEVPEFTGISSPYETPTDAEVTVDTTDLSRPQALETVLAHLRSGGWVTEETA